MEEDGKISAVEYLDWYFNCDDGGADKTAVEAWTTIKNSLEELRKSLLKYSQIVEYQKEKADRMMHNLQAVLDERSE